MTKNKLKMFIFDMDGLLVDTEKTYRDGWFQALKEQGIDVPEEVVLSWVGKGIHETTAYLTEYTGSSDVTETLRQLREAFIYSELRKGNILPKPYAKEVLETVKSHGYLTGLATSTAKKRAVDILTELELFDYIDVPVFATDVARVKPAPDLYQKVLALSGQQSENAVAVEDSITGSLSAQAAGLPTILVPDSNFQLQESAIPDNVMFKAETLQAVIDWLAQRSC